MNNMVRVQRALLDDGDLGRASLWCSVCLFVGRCLVVWTAKELHHVTNLVAIRRCGRHIAVQHLLEPVGHPNALPVLEFDLQVVTGIFLIIGKCQRQQVGLDAAGDVHTVKLYRTLGMAGGIFVAHVTTFFHGGKVELVCVSVSGSVRTIPAGNTK